MNDFAERLSSDREFQPAHSLLNQDVLMVGGKRLAQAANSLRRLALYEQQLLERKKREGQLPSGVESLYAKEYEVFRQTVLADAIEATRSCMDQFEASGMNLVVSRHITDTIKDDQLNIGALSKEVPDRLNERRLTILTESFGLSPDIADLGWERLLALDGIVSIEVLGESEFVDETKMGQGLRGGRGITVSGGHIPIHKGADLLIEDFLFVTEMTTEYYSKHIASNGLPVEGPASLASATRFAAGSDKLLFILGVLAFMVGLSLGGLWLALAFAGLLLMFETADAIIAGFGAGAGFVDP